MPSHCCCTCIFTRAHRKEESNTNHICITSCLSDGDITIAQVKACIIILTSLEFTCIAGLLFFVYNKYWQIRQKSIIPNLKSRKKSIPVSSFTFVAKDF